MQNGYDGIKEAGAAELIAISSDNTNGTSLTKNGLSISYLLLSDEDLQAITDYNVVEPNTPHLARPVAYIIDENGNIAWKDVGARYGHRTNSEQIITALNEL